MIALKSGGPAYPVIIGHNAFGQPVYAQGITLRDYFAASAPITVADANDAFYREFWRNAGSGEMIKTLVELRIRYANAMLAERAK